MTYEEITFKDPNPVKRWLQRRRLVTAINLARKSLSNPEVICDFGAGNGELCKLLSATYQHSRLLCYEPTPELLSEAQLNMIGYNNIEFYEDISNIPRESLDAIFCLEVFEHLPPVETAHALQTIFHLIKHEGIVVVGVPVEIGFPALYKGLFRMSRRFGAFDANIKNIAFSIICSPPKRRPISQITPRLHFYDEHLGFDYRDFLKVLVAYFDLLEVSGSPFSQFGPFLMPEIYFVVKKYLSSESLVKSHEVDTK
jgi:SAM-dependent methyltransferase